MQTLTSRYQYQITAVVVICLVASLSLVARITAASPDNSESVKTQREFFPVSRSISYGRATVHASRQLTSGFHILDGSDVQSIYSGDSSVIDALHSTSVRPLSLATDDFNGDGAPDLVAGYGTGVRGAIAIYKGNIEAFAPTSTAVYQAIQSRRTPESFDPVVRVVDLPEPADFMVIGDFNRDGKKDILSAAHSGGLYLLPGDLEGGFGSARAIVLPGSVTALTASGANVAVGITNEDGPSVLVFSARSNGLEGQPSRYPLTAEATSLAFDSLDNDQYLDLAAAAGNEVVILHGQAHGYATEHVDVGFNIQALTLGSFVWNRANNRSMALLSDDGSIQLLERSDLDTRPFSDEEAAALKPNALNGMGQSKASKAVTRAWQSGAKSGIQWSVTKQLGTSTANSASDAVRQSGRQLMLTTQVAPREVNDLLVIDQSAGKVNLLKPADDHLQAGNTSRAIPQAAIDSSSLSMDVEGTPAAVLLMRRKANGERDLIVLRANQAAPSSVIVTPQATITVDRVDDSHTSACTAAPNDCSLRGAIDFANSNPGTQINLPDPNTIGGSNHTYLLTIPGTHETNNVDGDLDIVASGTIVAGFGPKPIIQQTVAERVFDVNFASAANFFCELEFFVVKGGQDTSGLGGGGVLMGGPGNEYILDAGFDSNRVNGTATNTPGGAVSHITGGTLFVFGGSFTNNDSGTSRGGAIFVSRTLDKDARLTIGNASFVNNQASGSGGAIVEEINGGTPSFDDTIFANQFTGNKVIASAVDAQGGGAIVINVVSNTVDLNRNTFINNQVSVTGGHGGAISITSGKSISKYNRFVGNTAENGNTVFNFDASGTNDFTDNWWASLTGPKANDIVSAGGTFTTSPWITLGISPSLSTVPLNSSVMVTASLAKDSANNAIPDFFIFAMTNVPISFGGTGGNVTSAVPTTQSNGMAGALFNVTSPGIDTATATVDGATASTNITVIAGPTISTVFGAPTIPLNGSTSLSFTIQNSNASTTLTGIGFTDSLPAGLVLATPANLTGSCDAGTIQANAGSSFIILTGAQLTAGKSCTFSVDVNGTTAGLKTNTTGNVTANESDFGSPAISTISVVAPPSIAKAFGVATIALNGTTSLTFTLTNPAANAVAETGVAFTDVLPAGLLVATPNALTNTCGGTATATAGSNSISLSGGAIAVSSTCTVSVNVTATTSGQFTNVTGNVSSTNGGTGNTATANITVATPPTIIKAFGAASMPVNSTTALSFTINNPNGGTSLTGVGFTDNLPAGLMVATPNGLTGTCGLGIITATAGSGSISLTGASIPASGACAFSVNVTATSIGIKTNTTGNITATESGPGGTASANINVRQRFTTISIAFSANPVINGQTIQATATVVDIDTGSKSIPGGTMFFSSTSPSDEFTPSSTCSLSPVGSSTDSSSCQLNLSSMTTFTHSISANYNGSDIIHAANFGFADLTVNKANSASVLVSSVNPSVFGQSVTFTVTVNPVAPGSGVPTGKVTFLDGAIPIGTKFLDFSGSCSITVPNLSVGTHSISVNYPGEAGFIGSVSNVVNQVVNKDSTTTALASSVSPSSFGQSVTFTATVTAVAPGAGTPTGIVTFTDGATSLGTSNVAGGVATFSTATLSVGTHPIIATYNGDAIFTGSASVALNQVVTKAPSATALTSSLNPSVFGQPVTFTATVTSIGPPVNNLGSTTRGRNRVVQSRTQANRAVPSAFGLGIPSGTVTFFDGATQIGTGTLNGSGVAIFTTAALSAGVHSITASYGGDASFQSSTSPALIQTVNKANTASVVVSSVNPSVFGQPVTITVTVTAVAPGAGTPSGSVVIFGFLPPGFLPVSIPLNGSGVATQTFPIPEVGTHNVFANYSGDDNFNFSRSNLVNQVVNKDNSVTTVTASSNPAFVHTTVTYTATVTPAAPGAGIPTGLLQFKDNGVNIGAPVVLVNATASVTESNLTAGNHAITAIYSGDGNFNASTGTLAAGLNVGFKFVDTVSGNTLIVVPPANGQTGPGTFTWISNGVTIVSNAPAFIELNSQVLRIRSSTPSLNGTFDSTVPKGQAILFDSKTSKSFEIDITSFVLF